ncbi:MAG: hypothetical protein IT364_12505, partial [Candidatus Hydrogenedentes bacterium]|nr:hypothetical protein [Candidatus Hydrogenedentota bacterium]
PLLANGRRQIPATSPVALVSWREIDTIALIDIEAREVVWALTGLWKGQHEPVVTERGSIVVFDNRGLGEWSRIVEVDPVSQAAIWEYRGSPETPFSSMMGGAIHLLPNGNLFVVETTKGRAFEVTREKQIVWEYLSPHRIHEEEELVANLYDMVPVTAEEVPFIADLETHRGG